MALTVPILFSDNEIQALQAVAQPGDQNPVSDVVHRLVSPLVDRISRQRIANFLTTFQSLSLDNQLLLLSQLTPVIANLPPTVSGFTASPVQITSGQGSVLSWSVSGATSISIDQGIGAVPPTGSAPVSPTVTTTYTLTANNGPKTTTATVTVVVQ